MTTDVGPDPALVASQSSQSSLSRPEASIRGQATPGPWTLTHVAGNNFAVQCFRIRGMFGDKPNVYPIFNRDDSAIDGAVIYASPANARLIAAAPELYADLAVLVQAFGQSSDHGLWKRAKATLAKACGATSAQQDQPHVI